MRHSVTGATVVEVRRQRGSDIKLRTFRIINYGMRPSLLVIALELERLDPGQWQLDDGDVLTFKEIG